MVFVHTPRAPVVLRKQQVYLFAKFSEYYSRGGSFGTKFFRVLSVGRLIIYLRVRLVD